mmetsp:Transcript_94687/g.306262  ORF Transcript_94687/g.306262 Transcript_94687/m.306262 type:complete len:86 (+) Transcript_94687:149-406(+)
MDPDVKDNVNAGEWDLAYQDVVGENTENSKGIYQHDLGQDEKHLNTGDVEKMEDRMARGSWMRCARPDGRCVIPSSRAAEDRRGR